MSSSQVAARRYALIAPCRDEATTIRTTLDTLMRQTIPPTTLVVVDDGSRDATPEILREYALIWPALRIVTRGDRGVRAVGAGVIEAFDTGLATLDLDDYEFVCKIDMDLDLPEGYFAGLIALMDADPEIATVSGKPYHHTASGGLVAEFCGDETSVGMTKFYRVSCFRAIGGFVRAAGWDTIDCHTCRMHGWKATSLDRPDLRFIHLRPMGSSQVSIWVGRQRHGRGAWYLGSVPLYMVAVVVNRLFQRPFVVGAAGIALGYMKAWLSGAPRHNAPGYLAFVRGYQLRALVHGKNAAAEIMRQRARAKLRPRA